MSHRKIIYTPSGRAGEYADKGQALNIYQGCDHGCRYCYAAGMAEKFKKIPREQWNRNVVPAPDLFVRIAKDCSEFIAEEIFMCFMTDAYPATDNVREITRECIRIIVESQNSVNILTKGGMRAVQDFDLLVKNPRNKIGATLTFSDDGYSREWEPRAALPGNRIEMLSAARDLGIKTWASIEPVIIPRQSLEMIRMAAPHCDEIKIGKLNHDPREKKIDWKLFYSDAKALVEFLQKTYRFKVYFKKDLLNAAGVK